jgi:hypothetical protein
MCSFILSEIGTTLKYIDSILTTLSKNPNLFAFVSRFFWVIILIIISYISFKTVIFIYKRKDKKRCDQCMERSLTTITKFETLVSKYFEK